jgi:hypothetical protein
VTRYAATDTTTITVRAGETFVLESLRQPVVPPYVLIIPFLEGPPSLRILNQQPLDEDGIHGCTYTLAVDEPGTSVLHSGLRDLRTGQVTHDTTITLHVRAP